MLLNSAFFVFRKSTH